MFGTVGRQRGFKKTDGSPNQHEEQIIMFILLVVQPTRLDIVKCQAYRKGNDDVIRGDSTADDEHSIWKERVAPKD